MKKEQNNLDNKSSEELLKILIKENRADRKDSERVEIQKSALFLWDRAEQINANTDSRTGWSTAFFALVISSLLAIGFGVGTTITWYIVGSVMFLPLISIMLLIVAMNPHPTYEKAANIFMEGEWVGGIFQNIEHKLNPTPSNFDILKDTTTADLEAIRYRHVKVALAKMYKLINRKRFLLEKAYMITFPFLIPFILFQKLEWTKERLLEDEK